MIAHINNTEQGLSVRNKLNEVIDWVNQLGFKYVVDTYTNFTANNVTFELGYILIEADDLEIQPKIKLASGTLAYNDLPYFGVQLGLVKIIDLDGFFFTNLTTAKAYLRSMFTSPPAITNESFDSGVYYFTVPPNTIVDGYFLFDGISGLPNKVSCIDPLGLLTQFNSGASFCLNSGNHILGNCIFCNSDFYYFSGTVTIKNIVDIFSSLGSSFAEFSTGKFIIEGNIGPLETAQYTPFFRNSTSTIFVNAGKYTSNSGAIHGDLQTAIANGCNVFFDGIDKEDKKNKGVANGYAPLNSSTKIDTIYLPSYVDDVVEGYFLSNVFYEENTHLTVIPASGGKIYIDLTTGQNNKEYRYSGSTYIQITNGLIASTDDVTEGATNLYFTNARALAAAPAETPSSLGATINSSMAATPNDTDLVATVESSVLKKITWANVKAFLKTYFDVIYRTVEDLFATSITASTTLTLAQTNKWLRYNSASNGNLTIPSNATTAIPVGYYCYVRQSGLGTITLVPDTGVTLNAPSGVLSTGSQYDVIRITKQATDSWMVEVGAASWHNAITTVALNTKLSKSRSIQFSHSTLNPADSTTYYFGSNIVLNAANTTSTALRRNYAPLTGFLYAGHINVQVSSTLGTSETSTISINNLTQSTSSTLLATVKYNAISAGFSFELSTPFAVNIDDILEIKVVTPNFATNPISVIHLVTLYFGSKA